MPTDFNFSDCNGCRQLILDQVSELPLTRSQLAAINQLQYGILYLIVPRGQCSGACFICESLTLPRFSLLAIIIYCLEPHVSLWGNELCYFLNQLTIRWKKKVSCTRNYYFLISYSILSTPLRENDSSY